MLRLTVLAAVLVAVLSGIGILSSHGRQIARKKLTVPPIADEEGPKRGGRVLAINQDVANRIPTGFAGALTNQPHDNFERSFRGLLCKQNVEFLGWTYTVKSVVHAGDAAKVSVDITPRITEAGRSATGCGCIEAMYSFNRSTLSLVKAEITGSVNGLIAE